MSSRHNAARQEAEQYDRASQPTSRPWDCEAIADLFGITLHLEGRQLHIPYDRIDDAIKALTECKRLDPAPGDKKVKQVGREIDAGLKGE